MRRGLRVWARESIIAAVAIAGGTGCQLFMNLDISGYDAAPDASDGSACGGDAACISVACVSSADCDAGQVCCLGIGQSTSLSVVAGCQTGACDSITSIQLCRSSGECADSGSCSACTVGSPSLSVSLSACDSLMTSVACSP
jgi:hypothetical protein